MKIQKWKKLVAASPNLNSFLIFLYLILYLFLTTKDFRLTVPSLLGISIENHWKQVLEMQNGNQQTAEGTESSVGNLWGIEGNWGNLNSDLMSVLWRGRDEGGGKDGFKRQHDCATFLLLP